MACELPVRSRLQSEGGYGFSDYQHFQDTASSNPQSVRGSFRMIQLLSNMLSKKRSHPPPPPTGPSQQI